MRSCFEKYTILLFFLVVFFFFFFWTHCTGFPGGASGKEPSCQCRGYKRHGLNPWEDPLEETMAIHSNILAWKIPWTEEPGGLQSMGS